ncbi:MAG: ABC transporter permease [Clostridiales bacterium]|nr:ABC transporter permease [Clostridiales bacterium]MCF8023765.1 ABC transporter permease [Clostridiales bacterium]
MLWKKVIRDLNNNKGSYAACITIIAIGLMVFISLSMVIDNLNLSQDSYYRNQNFADGFAQIKAIPREEIDDLKNIKGINKIQGRLVKDVRVLSSAGKENVYLRLISIDPEEKNPVNGVRLEKGAQLNKNKLNIWLDNKFYSANNLELNNKIQVIIDGKERSLRTAGVGRSPEFIYALRTSSELYPSPETFGIAYIPSDVMEKLFSIKTVNDIVFTLDPGTSFSEIKNRIKPELKPYGLKKLYPRKDQTSHMLLSQELKGLKSMAQTMPVLFLAVAGMILYIMLKRMVEQQRGQIGILKAFGYTNREILFHYMSYALFTGTAGGITGGLLGIAMSYPFTEMYQTYFNMPGLNSNFSPEYLFTSILLSLSFSVFAGYMGCRKILAMQPAEAMSPPAPPSAGKTVIERIPVFWNMLTVQGIMAIRNIFRNKGRSIFILLGIMFTFSILGTTWSFKNIMDKVVFDQYEKIETYDVKVSLTNPRDRNDITRELKNFPGVDRVETMTEIPAALKNKWLKKEVTILGLPENSRLYNIMDKNYNKIKPPGEGILLSERLANLLNAKPGTKLNMNSVMQKRPDIEKKVVVVGVIPQYMGINAYMEDEELQNLIDQGEIATSAMLKINQKNITAFKKEYNRADNVSGISERSASLEESKKLMGSFAGMIGALALIGIITGFAIIYNSSVITLSERSHELASMMVLGMTPSEVLSVITFEQWFTGIFGMIAGIPLTKILLVGMAQTMSNDVYTLPSDMTGLSILIAFGATTVSIWIAQQAASRKIKKLSLVEALNSRE